MEEPVCDPPAVSLHYVSKLARRHVKVLLSGEGGDEAFGGYHTYRNFLLLEKLKAAAGPLKGGLSRAFQIAGRVPLFSKIGQFAPYTNRVPAEYYYSRATSPFSYFNRNKERLYTQGFYDQVDHERSTEVIDDLFQRVHDRPLLDQMQYVDVKTSLPDDLLVKADKMTMGNSLELRVPFLDHKVLEFAASLPPDYRVKGAMTKRILKGAFRKRIPKEIIKRKKAGFPIPIERWIQKELRDEVRQVLLSKRCLDRGYFRKESVEALLDSGDRGQPLAKEVFSLLTFELLQTQFVDR
jgi:asparagine synthase (glutamine-hydrolysing)